MAKDEKEPSVWGGIILLTMSLVILLIIAVISLPTKSVENYEKLYTEYSTTVTSYNNLRDTTLSIVNSCQNSSSVECNTAIVASKEAIPDQALTLPQKESLSVWKQYSSVVLVILLGGWAFILMALQAYRFQQASKKGRLYYEREAQKAVEQGRRETLVNIAKELVSDKDVMAELTIWLMEYNAGMAKMDRAAHVNSQILNRLMKQIHLNPIIKINQEVKYDPDQYINYEKMQVGEKAIVVEPGWRVGTEIIKPPIVRRK